MCTNIHTKSAEKIRKCIPIDKRFSYEQAIHVRNSKTKKKYLDFDKQ